MTRFKSVLCASLLTLALSSSAFAGEITGKSSQISSSTSTASVTIVGKAGEITGRLITTILGIAGMIS